MSNACLAWRQRPLAIPLRREDRVFYEEPGTASQEDWKGAVFIEELRKLGIRVDNTSPDADKMLIASFSRPRAFSGSINLDSREREYLRHRAREYRDVVGVSFGSPFGVSAIRFCRSFRLTCALSATPAAFQRAAGARPLRLYGTRRHHAGLRNKSIGDEQMNYIKNGFLAIALLCASSLSWAQGGGH